MKFVENNNQAAEYLRQAIPLMVKHNIPPNPLNYALWYAYVSKRLPKLNHELDEVLSTYGTCPEVSSERLFRDHMIREELAESEALEEGLLGILRDLGDHTAHTAQHTRDFSETLSQSIDALREADHQSVQSLIYNLSQKTETLVEITQMFQNRMDEAHQEMEDLKSELRKAREESQIEPLSGHYHRRAMDAILTPMLAGSHRGNIGFIMVDVDDFRDFNSEYGNQMGDRLIQVIGQLLTSLCAKPVLCSRHGGDEFLIATPNWSTEQTTLLANRIRERIDAIQLKDKRTGRVISSVTASVGVTRHNVGDTLEELTDRLEQAVLDAKTAGKNQVAQR